VTELPAAPVAVAGPGERYDLATGALLSMGLRLLASPWEPAPAASGWSVSLSPRSALVTCPDGDRYYEGSLDQPPQWRLAAKRLGSVELLAGTAGIAAAGPGQPGPGIAALEAAARAGRLVGATVSAVSRPAGDVTRRGRSAGPGGDGPGRAGVKRCRRRRRRPRG
jgi:hypothetical protein